MNEEQLKRLLTRAEEPAQEPGFCPVTLAGIRQRVRRRHLVRMGIPTAAAAMVLVGVTLWAICMRATGNRELEPQRIVSLEDQVKQLQAQTEATVKLVQEVLERDRQDRRLASLRAELARIPDPKREIDRQVDEAAFILVYQADKLYKELNQTDSAVRAYKDVIQLFPTNRWADVARERLSQIERRQFNKSDTQKGATAWEPRNT